MKNVKLLCVDNYVIRYVSIKAECYLRGQMI